MGKVGILTLPIKDNYGGILQAAALYEFLESYGCEVKLIQKAHYYPFWKKSLIGLLEYIPSQNIKGFRSRRINKEKHQKFIDEYLPNKTKVIETREELAQVARFEGFDAVVVGSDQVWRMQYIDKVYYGAYFLDFLEGTNTLRIAYAASFGVDYWQAPLKTQEIRKLLSKFDAISVRESTGISICSELGRDDVAHVLDPTLLVEKKFYETLLSNKLTSQVSDRILCYILDQTSFTDAVQNKVFGKISNAEIKYIFDSKSPYQKHTIPEWLKEFFEASFILTDSFHGMVFAIIFNKPFVVVVNQGRGAARFESLLNRLGLQNRMVHKNASYDVNHLIETPIDYDEVNSRLNTWRQESKNYLKASLNLQK